MDGRGPDDAVLLAESPRIGPLVWFPELGDGTPDQVQFELQGDDGRGAVAFGPEVGPTIEAGGPASLDVLLVAIDAALPAPVVDEQLPTQLSPVRTDPNTGEISL